ncbi:K02A2.6-like [Cordylochernes scorpioides]|uniref:K02A2.6-like n=1 Tax=Cordylochernes scorpioides TaxID=51811 RepID=A0ABY6KAP4_9ARAC|nr:K02A2.6-like [Cordylochernes scorpioides]
MFEKELQRMKRMGMIQEVDGPTEWVNSFTLVKKPNGQLQICLDPTELNKFINREHFQLPTLDEILPKLKNAKYFSVLDARNGFWQIKLHPDSTDLTTFITPFGRYKFLTLPFGLSSAPEVFQKRINEYFEVIEGTEMYFDDFLHITSSPLHSKSNGLVERSVQTIKNLINKARRGDEDPFLALLNFRSTKMMEWSPPQYYFLEEISELIYPIQIVVLSQDVEKKQIVQNGLHDRGSKEHCEELELLMSNVNKVVDSVALVAFQSGAEYSGISLNERLLMAQREIKLGTNEIEILEKETHLSPRANPFLRWSENKE